MAYNPGTQFRGDQYLFQGLSNFGAGVGQFAANRARKEKEDKELAEMSKRYSMILKGMGFGPGEVEAMSIGEKQGAIESAAMELTRSKQQMELATQQQQFDASRRYQSLMADAGQLAGGTGSGVYQPEYQARIEALMQNPAFAQDAQMAAAAGGPVSPAIADRYMTAPTWTPQAVDAGGVPMVMTSPKSAIPVPQHLRDQPGPAGQPVVSADGRFYLDDRTNAWIPLSQGSGSGPRISAAEAKRYTERESVINSELDEIDRKLSTASTWRILPGESRQSLEERRKRLEAELSGIQAALSGRGTPAAPQTSGPSAPIQTPSVDNDFFSGL